jgi:hypothetical protein
MVGISLRKSQLLSEKSNKQYTNTHTAQSLEKGIIIIIIIIIIADFKLISVQFNIIDVLKTSALSPI